MRESIDECLLKHHLGLSSFFTHCPSSVSDQVVATLGTQFESSIWEALDSIFSVVLALGHKVDMTFSPEETLSH